MFLFIFYIGGDNMKFDFSLARIINTDMIGIIFLSFSIFLVYGTRVILYIMAKFFKYDKKNMIVIIKGIGLILGFIGMLKVMHVI